MKKGKIVRINKQINEIEKDVGSFENINVNDSHDMLTKERSDYSGAIKKLMRIKKKILEDKSIDHKKLNKKLKRVSRIILKEFE